MIKLKNIAIVCGGDSGEYDISIESGQVVYNALDRSKYDPYLIVIKKSSWKCKGTNEQLYNIDKNDFSLTIDGRKIVFDAVFNAIHGSPGEDGKLLGYFDVMEIPYTSCNHVTSALTFNKNFCKHSVVAAGFRVASSVLLRKSCVYDKDQIINNLGLPIFVKPNNGGSSVGVSKVKHKNKFDAAVFEAFKYDKEVIVESFISGRELGCGAMEHKGEMIVFPITEIISKKEFFDYEAKYSKGMAEEITPALIDEAIESEIKATTAKLYHWLGCSGFVRFDYIVQNNDVYFLEVNTVPGMTMQSIIPQQANAMGISLKKLFDMALENIIGPSEAKKQ